MRWFKHVLVVISLVVFVGVVACGQGISEKAASDSRTATATRRHATPTPTAIPRPPATTGPITGGSIWRPALNSSWQWQLDSSALDPSIHVQVYDIDGFDRDAATVAALHAQGAKVICYIDAGTWENWRSDASKFSAAVKGSGVSGWPGEQWLDIRQIATLGPIMTARMDMCKAKGFDAIEPDNIDGYANKTGFPLTAQDQIVYNTFLANAAHQRGLSIGLKNDLDQVQQLLPLFDWALNEQCFQYHECNTLVPFIQAGKAVFNVEYNLDTSQFCPQADSMNFNSLKKHLALDAYRVACR
jgi:hypothetical protein